MMNQTMDNIAQGLLAALDGERRVSPSAEPLRLLAKIQQSDAEKSRAIIMVGHSMGGLVIAHVCAILLLFCTELY